MEDLIPPVVSGCPTTQRFTIPFGTTSRDVTWTEPTATDNSGVTPTVTRSHQPGQVFPSGMTEVQYTFVDVAGNSALCSFSVIIGKFYGNIHFLNSNMKVSVPSPPLTLFLGHRMKVPT